MSDIDPSQFMQKLLGSILETLDIDFDPLKTYPTELTIDNWPAVVSSVASLCPQITLERGGCIWDVILFLNSTDKSMEYIYVLGKILFEGRELSWKNFRMFLAVICQLSVIAYKENIMFLYDVLIFTAADYIRDYLSEHIKRLHGWRAFEADCVNVVQNRKELKKVRRSGPDSSMPSSASESMDSSDSLLLNEPNQCSSTSQTFERSRGVDARESIPKFDVETPEKASDSERTPVLRIRSQPTSAVIVDTIKITLAAMRLTR